MKEQRFLHIFGEIDDAYLMEAEKAPRRKCSSWVRRTAVAACVVLLATAVYGVMHLAPHENVVYPQVQEYEEDFNFAASQLGWSGFSLTFAQLADEADAIICADVTRVQPVSGGSNWYYSHATVKVREVLKGDVAVGESYIVRDSGGINTGEEVFVSCGGSVQYGPLMERHNRVVLFLKGGSGSDEDPFTIHTPTAGKFYLDDDGKYHNAVLYCVYKGDDDRWQDSDLADLKPKTLEEIKTLIHEKGLLYAHTDERVTMLDDSALSDKVYSVPGLMNAADAVVNADVTQTWSVPLGDGTSACYARLTVLYTFKGAAAKNETIVVRDNGIAYLDENGEATCYASYCGGPLMREGNRVVLFLSADGTAAGSEENPYTITTGVSGKFYYTRVGSYMNSMYYSVLYDTEFYEEHSRVTWRGIGTIADFKQTVWPLL